MARINLIPQTQKKRLFYKKLNKVLNLAFVGFLFLEAIFAVSIYGFNRYLDYKKNVFEKVLEQYHIQNKHYDELVSEISYYQKRLELIKKNNLDLDYRLIFEKISSLVPVGCRIDRISFSQEVLRISGVSPSFQAVAQFEKNLKNESDFINAKIAVVTPQEGLINFEIVVDKGTSSKK